MRWRRRTGEGAPGEPAGEPAEAYIELAREIEAEVARVAADPASHGELLAELIDRIPREQRMKFALAVFEELSPEQQWEVIERLFGDEEIRGYLASERDARLADVRANAVRRELSRTARADHALDTRAVPAGERLTLGLFRDGDVRAAIARGHTSSTCARRLVLRSLGDGRFQVIEDAFNPNGGYFVTGDYSEDTWREHDRLPGHAVVRVGSITDEQFEPVLHPGGRVDVETGGQFFRGRLQLGFAMLGDIDVFIP